MQLADRERRVAQRWIGQVGAGIEIEREPVGLRGFAASPRPSCATPRRRPARDAAVPRASRRRRSPDPCRRSESCTMRKPALDFSRKCFWKNGFDPCVLRRMRQRPVPVVRHGVFADRREVLGELQFGDAVVREQHAIGMREAPERSGTADSAAATAFRAVPRFVATFLRRGLRCFLHDVLGVRGFFANHGLRIAVLRAGRDSAAGAGCRHASSPRTPPGSRARASSSARSRRSACPGRLSNGLSFRASFFDALVPFGAFVRHRSRRRRGRRISSPCRTSRRPAARRTCPCRGPVERRRRPPRTPVRDGT